MKKLFALLLALLTLTGAASAETLRLYQVVPADDFPSQHPGVTLYTNYADDVRFFYGVMELHNALLAGTFDWDVFETFTHETDLRLLMEKGYLLDLSGSEIVRDYVARLYPDIAAQCVLDGKIYAVPMDGIWDESGPKLVWPEKWQEAGYTEADIPQTFGAYLDFIDAWLDRREDDPGLTLNVFADFTPFVYDIHSYSGRLVDELLDSHIAQLVYAGQPLSFSDPDLIPLLEKAKAVGERIFRFEPTKTDSNSNFGLFGYSNMSFEEQARWQANLRIHEDQPLLQSYFLPMTAVYAGTSNPELAIAAVESSLLRYLSEEVHQARIAMMRTDAQPVLNPNYEPQQRLKQNYIDMCERRLAGDDTPYTEYIDMTGLDEYWGNMSYFAGELKTMSEADIRDEIARRREDMAWYKRYEYSVSPEFLAAWRQHAQHLYFPGPNIFTADEGYENFKSLKKQFVDGLISARQLANELDRIAWMMEMENQ